MDILRNFPTWRGVIAFDRFSLRVMLMKPTPRTGPPAPREQWVPKIMLDVDCTNTLAWFHALGMTKLTINMLHNAMVAVAQVMPSIPCSTISTASAPDPNRPCRHRPTAI